MIDHHTDRRDLAAYFASIALLALIALIPPLRHADTPPSDVRTMVKTTLMKIMLTMGMMQEKP